MGSDTTADGLTMGDLRQQRGKLFAHCRDCGRERDIDPAKIAVADDVEVLDVGRRLPCRDCNSTSILSSPQWEDQA